MAERRAELDALKHEAGGARTYGRVNAKPEVRQRLRYLRFRMRDEEAGLALRSLV